MVSRKQPAKFGKIRGKFGTVTGKIRKFGTGKFGKIRGKFGTVTGKIRENSGQLPVSVGYGGVGEEDWPEVQVTDTLLDWLTSSTLDGKIRDGKFGKFGTVTSFCGLGRSRRGGLARSPGDRHTARLAHVYHARRALQSCCLTSRHRSSRQRVTDSIVRHDIPSAPAHIEQSPSVVV